MFSQSLTLMTKKQAEELRNAWKAKAPEGETCEHSLLVLESTDKGYLTGTYFCACCGEHVVRKMP